MGGIKSIGKYILTFVLALSLILVMNGYSFAKDLKYSVTERSDGGYTLKISYSIRHWIPITAEGPFPLEKGHCTIDIIGKGKEYTSGAGNNGYLYTQEYIKGISAVWDFGYAWIDANREYLYLNLYWMVLPDGSAPSQINGKYKLKRKIKE